MGKKAANKAQEIQAVEGDAPETAEELQPIPHNDQKALASEVNSLRVRVAELEAKLERLTSAWGDPDEKTGEGDTN